MAPPKATSHAEIWDDSALVDSWNEALEEYKHYHSMQARGEKVGDILKDSSKQSNRLSEGVYYEAGEVDGRQAEIAHKAEDHVQTLNGNKEQPSLAHDDRQDKKSEKSQATSQASAATVPSLSNSSPSKEHALPQRLIGQVHDEGLKSLLMSWYYAGYYTGLYEGQNQKSA